MWNYISANQAAVSTASSTAGINRVLSGDYAFLIEYVTFGHTTDFPALTAPRSTTSEYNIMRNCELTSIGGLLDSKGYGFGVPQSERTTLRGNRVHWIAL